MALAIRTQTSPDYWMDDLPALLTAIELIREAEAKRGR